MVGMAVLRTEDLEGGDRS